MIGHRGAPGFRPEHTRASYELAIAQGADAVEPDVVVSRDGVLVIRHDVELSETTDVASRPGFADRRTVKTVEGVELDGWFCEDFTWDELSTLTARERIPQLRPESARFDGQQPILRLRDLLGMLDAADREVVPVIEAKHPAHLAAAGHDLAALLDAELQACGWADGRRRVIVECFDAALLAQLRERGVRAELVALVESHVELQQLDLAGIDGVSVDKRMLLDAEGVALVQGLHARGMQVFTWTLRPENVFLDARFRSGPDAAAFGDYAAEWAAIRETGVDAVFVDHPALWSDTPF
jgi:glycerophosphoryl diester phosphodiesterase